MGAIVELRKPFVPSIDRRKLYELLRGVKPGEVVAFDALSAAIGRDVLLCRWLLAGARRSARDSDRKVFEAVRNVGLRCLPNEEVPDRGPRAIGKARRAVWRGTKEVKTADYGSLSASGQVTFNMSLSMSGALMLMTKPSRMKSLPPSVETKYDPKETVRLLMATRKK